MVWIRVLIKRRNPVIAHHLPWDLQQPILHSSVLLFSVCAHVRATYLRWGGCPDQSQIATLKGY